MLSNTSRENGSVFDVAGVRVLETDILSRLAVGLWLNPYWEGSGCVTVVGDGCNGFENVPLRLCDFLCRKSFDGGRGGIKGGSVLMGEDIISPQSSSASKTFDMAGARTGGAAAGCM